MNIHHAFYQALHELNPKAFPRYELDFLLNNQGICLRAEGYVAQWNYAAVNKDGQACLFINKPEIVGDEWKDTKSTLRCAVWNVVPFIGDWKKSLIERKQ